MKEPAGRTYHPVATNIDDDSAGFSTIPVTLPASSVSLTPRAPDLPSVHDRFRDVREESRADFLLDRRAEQAECLGVTPRGSSRGVTRVAVERLDAFGDVVENREQHVEIVGAER